MMRSAAMWSALLLLLTGIIGCGKGTKAPEPADPEEARSALRDVLDAWKQGETPAALAERTPPVHVADEDWSAGVRLKRYELKNDGEVLGTSLRCSAVLHMQDGRGAPLAPKTVLYHVGTNPRVSVVRADGS